MNFLLVDRRSIHPQVISPSLTWVNFAYFFVHGFLFLVFFVSFPKGCFCFLFKPMTIVGIDNYSMYTLLWTIYITVSWPKGDERNIVIYFRKKILHIFTLLFADTRSRKFLYIGTDTDINIVSVHL